MGMRLEGNGYLYQGTTLVVPQMQQEKARALAPEEWASINENL